MSINSVTIDLSLFYHSLSHILPNEKSSILSSFGQFEALWHNSTEGQNLFNSFNYKLSPLLNSSSQKWLSNHLAGRICASELLLKYNQGPLPTRTELVSPFNENQKAPIWPGGFNGSISHTNGFAGAIVTNDCNIRLGLDIENIGRKISDNLLSYITTEEELKKLKVISRTTISKRELAILIFSFKESIYKGSRASLQNKISWKDIQITEIGDNFWKFRFNGENIEESVGNTVCFYQFFEQYLISICCSMENC